MIKTQADEKQISQSEVDIDLVCQEIAGMLKSKNRSYGDSALNPVRIFSSAAADEAIRVRIDDKLSRLASQPGAFGEDAELDLLGYLILHRIARLRKAGTAWRSPLKDKLDHQLPYPGH